MQQTCDPGSGLPLPGEGACAGIETLTGTISGGIDGRYLAQSNFAVLPSGESSFTSFDVITGTIAGRGAGSLTILETCSASAAREVKCRWSVVAGSATGDFAGVTGEGENVGSYDATTGLASAQLSGLLRFHE